jgi:hypothetical protein
VATDLRAGSIRILRTPAPEPQRRIGLLHTGGTPQPAVARVMQIVRESSAGRTNSTSAADRS